MSKRRQVIDGEKFGRLTIVKEVLDDRYGRYMLTKCICGNEKVASLGGLVGGRIQSCGCLNRENFFKINHLPKREKKFFVNKGDRFGRLTVVREIPLPKGERRMIEVKCDCGKVISVGYTTLKGKQKSCGCISIEKIIERSTKHGNAKRKLKTAEYNSWVGMLNRCNDINNHAYNDYGGRGIKVCDRWMGENGFSNFLSDVGVKPTKQHSIDRYPDKNGNYETTNVRWATKEEQSDNRRNNRFAEHLGEKKSIKEWAKIYNTKYKTFWYRLKSSEWNMDILIFRYYQQFLHLKESV